jgi:hypothetical protein
MGCTAISLLSCAGSSKECGANHFGSSQSTINEAAHQSTMHYKITPYCANEYMSKFKQTWQNEIVKSTKAKFIERS